MFTGPANAGRYGAARVEPAEAKPAPTTVGAGFSLGSWLLDDQRAEAADAG